MTAQSVIGKLLELFKDDYHASLRRGVEVLYEAAEPKVDFEAYNLDSKWADDYLLATILSFKTVQPASNIVIVTDDPNIIIKSRQYGMKALRLANEFKLPEALDAYDKEKKELERTIQELKSGLRSTAGL